MHLKNKKILYAGIILAMVLFMYGPRHLSDKVPVKNELMAMHYFLFLYNSRTFQEHGQFPLWIDTMYSGTPFFALPQAETLLFHVLPFYWWSPNPELSLNLVVMLQAFFAGLFMFLLMLDMGLKPKYAFMSGIVYLTNGFLLLTSMSWLQRYKVLMFIPLSFLFMRRAFRKDIIPNSILAGFFLALQFHGGGLDFFMFTAVIPMTYALYQLFGKNIPRRITKVLIVGVIMILVFGGLIAVKMLPMMEFNEQSSKAGDFPFKDSVHRKIKDFKEVLMLPFNIAGERYPTRIGVVAFLLLLASLLKWKKRENMFLYILIIVGILVCSGSFLFYLLWKFIPGFSKLHHVQRGLVLFTFPAAMLTGIGASILFKRLKKIGGFFKKNLNLIFIIVMIIFLFDTVWIAKANYYDFENNPQFAENKPIAESIAAQVSHNYLLQNLSKEPGIFRVENIGTATHSGQSILHIMTLDMHQIYGATSLWITEYFNVYLSFAHSQPAKFHGILNAKYLYSEAPVNKSFLTFVHKFPDCEDCWETQTTDHGVDGPYLYKNELYLPRAYMVDYAVLSVGEQNSAKGNMYAMLSDSTFDPSNTVIIMKSGLINDIDVLDKISLVLLTQGSVNDDSIVALTNFANAGGILVPNIIDGATTVSQQEIQSAFSFFKGNYSDVDEVEILDYTPNEIKFRVTKTGWMVLSEKFYMFEGWHCTIGNKEFPFYRANGVISTMYVDKTGDMNCIYKPKSFRNGVLISVGTLLLIILFFGYRKYRRILIASKESSNLLSKKIQN